MPFHRAQEPGLANQNSSLGLSNSTYSEKKKGPQIHAPMGESSGFAVSWACVLFFRALGCQVVAWVQFSGYEGHLNSGNENKGNTLREVRDGIRGRGENPTASSELLDLLLPEA